LSPKKNQRKLKKKTEIMEKWTGKVAVVTGASAAIGAAVCKDLVEAGMIVCGLSKRKDKMEAIRRTLFDVPGQLNCIECDIRDEKQVQAAFKWIEDVYGSVSLLINNAGVNTSKLLLDENNSTELYRTMETNIIGLCLVTREAIKLMKKQEEVETEGPATGHVVNINSIFGHKVHSAVPGTKPINGLYPASKFAVTAITECVRQELEHKNLRIKISCVTPGLVEGDGLATSPHELLKLMPKLKPEHVSQAVLYAISVPDNVVVHEIIMKPVGEFL
jgi:NADP+-dependent farnesol dehydrogenase